MKKVFLTLIVLTIAASCYALKKPVSLNKIMTVSQDVQLYKDVSSSAQEAGSIASNEFVAIQKIGPEAIIEGIKSNWVCVYILDEEKFRNGEISYTGRKGWCFGGFLDNINVMKNTFANPYLILKDGIGSDITLYGKTKDKFYASEIVEADESKTKVVNGQKWFFIRKLNQTNYSYYKENVDHETAIEKITATEPYDLFGTEEIVIDRWESWTSVKPYSLENYREVADGDYCVNKIYASSVQDDLIYPYENTSLVLHVEGENAWLCDASTLRRYYNPDKYDYGEFVNKVHLGRWNDCSWDDSGSIYTEYVYERMPARSGYFWGGHKYDDEEYSEFFNPFCQDLNTNYCMHYKDEYHWADRVYNRDEESAFMNKVVLFAASIDHGLQNEYIYVFEPTDVKPRFRYDIHLPVYVMLKNDCKAYSSDDFSNEADTVLPANYNGIDPIETNITLEEMKVLNEGVYYKANNDGNFVWVYEYDLPAKCVFSSVENMERYINYSNK